MKNDWKADKEQTQKYMLFKKLLTEARKHRSHKDREHKAIGVINYFMQVASFLPVVENEDLRCNYCYYYTHEGNLFVQS